MMHTMLRVETADNIFDSMTAFVSTKTFPNLLPNSDIYVLLIGRTCKQTICKLELKENYPEGLIGLNKDAQCNLNVTNKHDVRIQHVNTLEEIQKIVFVPVLGSSLSNDINLKTKVLFPYCNQGVRIFHTGSIFTIKTDSLEISFQVLEVKTEQGKFYGKFSHETSVHMKEPIPRPPRAIGFDDIGGLGKQLPQIRTIVELTLNHPELFDGYGVKRPKGILMYGPPGTGKTLIAAALAGEVGAYFLSLSGPEIVDKLAGQSEQNLREAFEACQRQDRSILFIDEIDAIAPKREKTQGELEKRIVAQMLTLMDGIRTGSNMVIIAATNRPNSIDPALRRPGRFDKEVSIGIPDKEDRLEILKVHTRRMKLEGNFLEQIARDTHGYVGADLAALCSEAAMNQIKDLAEQLGPAHLDQARDKLPGVTQKSFEDALAATNASGLREMAIEMPDVDWEDIGGLEDIKSLLTETIEGPIKYPEAFTDFGISPARGLLFYGPPGCGKTLIAKAIAKQSGANFISVKGPELLNQWFGESEANIRELFDKARAAAPCIIFFDEIDSIAKSRGSSEGGAGAASDRVINQLLTEIDGIGAKKKIFIIAATNRPDVIDSALMRPGRLDQKIYIPLPDEANREAILKATLRRTKYSDEIDLKVIAKVTNGFSSADLNEICTNACKIAIRDRIKNIEAFKKRNEERNRRGFVTSDDKYEEVVTQITKEHFKQAMRSASRSVSEKDVRIYEIFKSKNSEGSADLRNFDFPLSSNCGNNDNENGGNRVTNVSATESDSDEDYYK
uniref:AAA+ ATPase domain-containing protein n=1 Tax=Panagrolaimus sp. ES5 TaxID=591445 RepID=A0AC34GT89_9BILA